MSEKLQVERPQTRWREQVREDIVNKTEEEWTQMQDEHLW